LTILEPFRVDVLLLQREVSTVRPAVSLTSLDGAFCNGCLFFSCYSSRQGRSSSRIAAISVAAIDDPPSFVKGGDASATDESGPQTITGWATNISAGPSNEAGQKLHFVVHANADPTLFAAGPAIDASGNLTFTPAPNVSGSAQITIYLADDGGTAGGGVDVSQPQAFNISVSKAHPWHNAANALDVTDDGHVVPVDALVVINFINAFGSTKVPANAGPSAPYYDVNADGTVSPIDALSIINHLNAFGSAEGESRAHVDAFLDAYDSSGELLDLLAFDVALQSKRRAY